MILADDELDLRGVDRLRNEHQDEAFDGFYNQDGR
jgi:hypothetical protein